jgi:hypothetical protein
MTQLLTMTMMHRESKRMLSMNRGHSVGDRVCICCNRPKTIIMDSCSCPLKNASKYSPRELSGAIREMAGILLCDNETFQQAMFKIGDAPPINMSSLGLIVQRTNDDDILFVLQKHNNRLKLVITFNKGQDRIKPVKYIEICPLDVLLWFHHYGDSRRPIEAIKWKGIGKSSDEVESYKSVMMRSFLTKRVFNDIKSPILFNGKYTGLSLHQIMMLDPEYFVRAIANWSHMVRNRGPLPNYIGFPFGKYLTMHARRMLGESPIGACEIPVPCLRCCYPLSDKMRKNGYYHAQCLC